QQIGAAGSSHSQREAEPATSHDDVVAGQVKQRQQGYPEEIRISLDVLAGMPDEPDTVAEVACVAIRDVRIVTGVVEVEDAVEQQDERGAADRRPGIFPR